VSDERVTVPKTLAGERVDRAVALLLDWSRADVAALCDRGSVLVDGRPAAKSRRLAEGDVVELLDEPAAPVRPGPDPAVPVDVRHEDADLLVVAKPAGLVVHPGAGRPGGTLVNGLLARYPELAEVGDPARPGIVHRLDRDTSGLLAVARTRRAFDALVAQLTTRSVHRAYLALVWGVPEAHRGIVDAPIGRSPASRTRMAVRAGGKEARTEYEVQEVFDDPAVAVLRCTLETGRTHQIRVHLAAIGHPVVGDAAYGGARPALALARPFLHAAELSVEHPVTGERVAVSEPLPDDLAVLLTSLRSQTRNE
jgi:23S rRNA pseudouridine1911/1915/1917 synthase